MGKWDAATTARSMTQPIQQQQRRISIRVANDEHQRALLTAIDKLLAAKMDVTTGVLHDAYMTEDLPFPMHHVGIRQMGNHLRTLEQRGHITIHIVSRGRFGVTSIIERR